MRFKIIGGTARRPGSAAPAGNASGSPSPSGWRTEPGNSARLVVGRGRTTFGTPPGRDGEVRTRRTTSGHALRSTRSNKDTGTVRPSSSRHVPPYEHADLPIAERSRVSASAKRRDKPTDHSQSPARRRRDHWSGGCSTTQFTTARGYPAVRAARSRADQGCGVTAHKGPDHVTA